MSGVLARVIVGNVIINPKVLIKFLKKSHYFMEYKPEEMLIRFRANDGDGGEILFEIGNASHENAVKLAEGLGLKSEMKESVATLWAKWNPIYKLWSDGSGDSEALRVEILKSGIPCHFHNSHYGVDSRGNKSWAFQTSGCIYRPPMWKADGIIKIIREDAERYKDQLSTMP